ncbi:LOW QUALITY PROTEIN: hypothetical protein, conserved [Eimeria necatrix]|uniref:Uncharacterized protein n=1 Tax=Eimeria necatrix TaxID=51315 RepID=U6MX55_9EIME|nr:LOW QUALITY PROTEIN: hypothetical protein, conserved [Eimeria necatrix]CDJ67064.1 hypothetical protein, conserved [Eimeria necatrix]
MQRLGFGCPDPVSAAENPKSSVGSGPIQSVFFLFEDCAYTIAEDTTVQHERANILESLNCVLDKGLFSVLYRVSVSICPLEGHALLSKVGEVDFGITEFPIVYLT